MAGHEVLAYRGDMPTNEPARPAQLYGQRPSKTASAMFEAKMKRIRAMTPLERVKLALRLGQQARKLKTPAKP